MNNKSLRSGFTFIELIIALAILAVLSVVIIPGTFRYLKQSKITKTETTLGTLRTAISSYYASVGKYPTSLTDLIRKPADVPLKKWVDKFLDLDDV
ncbi:MAG: prepilin-type N-terminal cleavage/methylation domain-containing protein, partial [Candidatus Babeliales bacterium]|nr:prepilin-type N-terminal cleavage/methylation domain-containing protein [Candidatus Babeliales bacterium]